MNNKTIGIIVLLLAVVAVAVLAINLTRDNSAGGAQNNESEREEVQLIPAVSENSWRWESSILADGTEVRANDPDEFILSFNVEEKRFSSFTDCNNLMGMYEVGEDGVLGFSQIASTLMFCEDSQEVEYKEMLETVRSYEVDSEGNLRLAFEGGVMNFSPTQAQ